MTSSIVCANCGKTIDPVRDPSFCPVCGAGDRHIEVRDQALLRTYEDTYLRKKPTGGKWSEKSWIGFNQFHLTGQWNWRKRVVDRENDRYFEQIVDAEGNVIRHVEERLSEHRGHGHAKHAKKRKKPRSS